MDILQSVLSGAAIGGGVFGLLGHAAARLFALIQARESFAQKSAAWAHERELLRLQLAAPAPETERAPAMPDLAPLVAPDDNLMLAPSYGWVNAVRALVRPALAIGLAAVLAAAFFAAVPGDAVRTGIANSLVFAAVTAIVWWFGDRAPRPN